MPEFRIKVKVTSAETIQHQRHPPGGLAKWQAKGAQGPPPREDVDLTLVTVTAVDDHGHYNQVERDSAGVHVIGHLDLRSLHPEFAAQFPPGQEFILTFAPVEA